MKATYPMAIVTRPGEVEFRDQTLKELGSNEVLVKVKAASLCGSDLHIFKGKHLAAPLPVAIGHEIAGEVLEIGGGVSRFQKGDRVTIEPVIVCGECHFCKRGMYHLCIDISFQYRQGQGGFAPYFIAEERWVHRLPAGLAFEEGALIEPLSVAMHAVNKAAIQLGQTCAIFGAGAIGLLALLLAKLSGGGRTFVIDIQDHRLKAARELGASMTFNNLEEDVVERILECTDRLGVDRSFEAVGIQETLVQSLSVLKKGGVSMLIGIFEEPHINIPSNLIVQNEISLTGSQGYCWEFEKALELVEQKSLDLSSLITHVLPLSSLPEAFELLMDPGNEAIKVVMAMD